ncbi:MAG TPA: ABC transporter permease [Longimicrobiales bacterium]|nr:ABC transporter permease [Longimicrobiales bacterium]
MRMRLLTATSIHEGVRLAFDQLRANRMRSGLTIIGIVVGVATVLLMSAVIGGVRGGIMESFEAAGPKNFIVARFNMMSVSFDSDGPPWEGTPEITPAEARLLERLPSVERAIVDLDLQATVQFGSERLTGVQTSVSGAGWDDFTVGSFVAGQNYSRADLDASRPVVVLSKALADQLFGRLYPVGRQVRLNGQRFTVVGVFEMKGNIFANLVKNFMVVPHTAAFKYLNVDDTFLAILVVTEDDATQAKAIDDVITALRVRRSLRPSEPNDFVIIRQDQMIESFNRMTAMFFAAMIGLSSVALMVGGVGVIAIMMIAVTERTREIGVRKALGATRREILLQFLVEAVTLTLIGSVLGLAIGGALAALLASVTPIPASVPLPAIVAALVMASVAGVLFGLWPAWRASRLDPVDALRYE